MPIDIAPSWSPASPPCYGTIFRTQRGERGANPIIFGAFAPLGMVVVPSGS